MSDHNDVNKPKHYDLFPNQQVIDVIEAYLTEEEFAGYCKGNALKYRLRAGDKGDALKCIAKANWHQNKLREVESATFRKSREERNSSWTPGAIEAAAFRRSCDSAESERPDDAINESSFKDAYKEYTLQEVIGDAVLSDWARWVAVDEDGEVWEYSQRPTEGKNWWHREADFKGENINKVVPPINFKNCIFEVKK